KKVGLGSALILGEKSNLLADASGAQQGNALEYKFLEGCTCNMPCSCALTGKFAAMCQGAIAWVIKSGVFEGKDLAGAKMVNVGHAGEWGYVYIDAPESLREATTALARIVFAPLGKIESVKIAAVGLSGENGRYRLTIDSGKTLDMTTEPVLGGDKKTPIVHSNTVIGTLMQGRTIKGSFQDGERTFTWADGNSFFNENANKKIG